MDLIGDMLCRHLAGNCESGVNVTQLTPTLRNRLGRVPLVPAKLLRNADRLLNRFYDYPEWLRSKVEQYDVFHLVDHSYSQLLHVLPAHRTVVTCHDLDTFRCLLEPELEPRPRWFRAMAQRILNGFLRAAHVIAVSSATRDGLVRYGLFPSGKITVVWNGVHPSCSLQPDPAADARATELMPAGSGTFWLLNVGNTMARKRLDILLRVFATVRRTTPEARLMRVGGLTNAHLRLAEELGILDSITVLPFQERDVLAAIYRRANLLVHTAEAEGFGLPLIEAMACGCPVAASDIPVLREVGGAAATYCPVGDIQSWADTVVGLVYEKNERPSSWDHRRQLQSVHAERFSWAENARQTARIYQQVVRP